MLRLFATVVSVSLSLAPAGATHAFTPEPLEPDEAYALVAAPTRHVRALDPALAEVLAEGIYRSPTFGRIVADIQRSDVIVQIVASQNLPASTPARLILVPGAKAYRFVRIQMRPEGSPADLIAALGHELQHAREIANAPEVRDDRSLIALYRRIGFSDVLGTQFDTHQAHDVAAHVRRELWEGAPSRPRSLRFLP